MNTKNKLKWASGNNRPIVLLDMDDVITDLLKSIIEHSNRKFNKKYKSDDCKEWGLYKMYNVDPKEIDKIFRSKRFFENLLPKSESVNTIKDLIKSSKYDLYIVTATSDIDGSEFVQKLKWIKRHIPEFNIKRLIACQDKYVIRGDVLVDDKIKNLEECEKYMDCILMDSPPNRECNKYTRIKSLKELPDILNTMFYND